MVTMEQVRRALDSDEPDYERAAMLGAEALVHLRTLVESNDPYIAPRAAYLAGLIDGEDETGIVAEATRSPEPTVRVAAAAVARRMAQPTERGVRRALAVDPDAGVRRWAGAGARGSDVCECSGALTLAAAVDPRVNVVVVLVSDATGGAVRNIPSSAFEVTVLTADVGLVVETVTEKRSVGAYEIRVHPLDDAKGQHPVAVAVHAGESRGRCLGVVELGESKHRVTTMRAGPRAELKAPRGLPLAKLGDGTNDKKAK